MPEDRVVDIVEPTRPLPVTAPDRVTVPEVTASKVFSHAAEKGTMSDVVLEVLRLIQVSS